MMNAECRTVGHSIFLILLFDIPLRFAILPPAMINADPVLKPFFRFGPIILPDGMNVRKDKCNMFKMA
ncbi:hypothetical protein DYD21_18080 [Rhodohalobacter sp. SW132]|nr:hypothetical protein DYD21_18080 [Rhodohalobacter sp. SW132]